MAVRLNGFRVDPAVARLMERPDWPGQRTDEAWLGRFPAHWESGRRSVPFVEFCGVEWAVRENAQVRKAELAILRGSPSGEYPPGDFDPTAGYLIGFTEMADAAICVDLRPVGGARIIYECLGPRPTYATAFDSIAEFVEFYLGRHGG